MGEDVHARGVHPDEKRLVGLGLFLDEGLRSGRGFVVDGFHALAGQRAGVFDLAVGVAVDHATGCAGFDEVRVILGPVRALGFFFGVEVIQVAEELVETVVGRQEFILVAEVVLAELAGRVTLGLERLGDGDVTLLDTDRRTRYADLGQAGAQRRLACDERRPPGGATVLRVVVGEDHAFLGDAVDVRRLVADHAHGIGADVGLADVVAEDHQNVGFVSGVRRHSHDRCRHEGEFRQPLCYASHLTGSLLTGVAQGDPAAMFERRQKVCATHIRWP
ncbi:hypothetical protein D3C87_1286170 [compost metagenome]